MKDAIYEGLIKFVTHIIEDAKEVNSPMWQALQEWRNTHKDISALESAHWIVEYLEESEPERIELLVSKKDFRKLIKLIKEAKE